jgi:hypothetical protein
MNKIFILISIIILSVEVTGFSQHALLFKNKTSDSEKIIPEGTRVKIVCYNDSIFRGVLKFKDNCIWVGGDSIYFGSSKINIIDIKSIKKVHIFKYFIGTPITALGTFLLLGTILFPATQSNYGTVGGSLDLNYAGTFNTIGIVSGAFFSIVGILILSSGTKFNSSEWVISLK